MKQVITPSTTRAIRSKAWKGVTQRSLAVNGMNAFTNNFSQNLLLIHHQRQFFSTKKEKVTKESWSDEWKEAGLGAEKAQDAKMTNLLFVQTGFGVDQHGDRKKDGATKAAVRAVRNAIEFNSIPGMIEAVPGGRKNMLIEVKLGVPPKDENSDLLVPIDVDLDHVAKVFPYGKLMPIQVTVGGLLFPTGRIVRELGDENDTAICVAASVSLGYDNGERNKDSKTQHKTYDTKDGY
ncbi:hypothetical protein CTEN210_00222 [Chaetoceros tenuissimus]|uniref:Uncharacterized protein n=1 Tax=Chaetoceros tenuissimus TaxID=426638 RepID=A0AAD3CDQ1_9STRA|nr:hypothetical protein CTEN210_00222 [Chaetoceros tenuissimus]